MILNFMFPRIKTVNSACTANIKFTAYIDKSINLSAICAINTLYSTLLKIKLHIKYARYIPSSTISLALSINIKS